MVYFVIMDGKDRIRFAEHRCSLGVILIAGAGSGITDLSLSAGSADIGEFLESVMEKYGCLPLWDDAFFKEAFSQIDRYFSGVPMEFTLPVDLKGTVFEMKVWRAIRAIPRGRTLSYKELALRAGSPAASRAAGSACGKNPVPLIIPCHRVVGSNGSLGGYTGGLEIKKMLLKIEGALP